MYCYFYYHYYIVNSRIVNSNLLYHILTYENLIIPTETYIYEGLKSYINYKLNFDVTNDREMIIENCKKLLVEIQWSNIPNNCIYYYIICYY